MAATGTKMYIFSHKLTEFKLNLPCKAITGVSAFVWPLRSKKCHGHERQIEFDSLSPRQSTQLPHVHRVDDISSMIKVINHPKMTILSSFTLTLQTRKTVSSSRSKIIL